MTTKYCSSCSSTRNIEGGQIVSFRCADGATRTRWRCRHCATQSSESVYAKKAKIKKPVETTN